MSSPRSAGPSSTWRPATWAFRGLEFVPCQKISARIREQFRHRAVLVVAKRRIFTMGHSEDRYRAAAAECLEAANRTTDQGARATLLLMAQKWLDLASEKSGARRFGGLLDDFNEQQMLDRPKT
jgi:hypothetical protein